MVRFQHLDQLAEGRASRGIHVSQPIECDCEGAVPEDAEVQMNSSRHKRERGAYLGIVTAVRESATSIPFASPKGAGI